MLTKVRTLSTLTSKSYQLNDFNISDYGIDSTILFSSVKMQHEAQLDDFIVLNKKL